jgi:flagellar biosynthesis protein FlhB
MLGCKPTQKILLQFFIDILLLFDHLPAILELQRITIESIVVFLETAIGSIVILCVLGCIFICEALFILADLQHYNR